MQYTFFEGGVQRITISLLQVLILVTFSSPKCAVHTYTVLEGLAIAHAVTLSTFCEIQIE